MSGLCEICEERQGKEREDGRFVCNKDGCLIEWEDQCIAEESSFRAYGMEA